MHYLNGTNCLPCSSYCETCNSTACIQCQNPFVLVNGSCQSCVVTNALSCTSIVSASSCKSNYYVNDNYCSSCLLNCATCTSSSTCTACNTNYYLNTSILTCSPCSSHCTSCNQYSPTTCITCDNGYYVNSSNYCSAYTCSLTNCVYCSSNNVCGQCS
jgi:proprotein convertase subtilisin/kexin type 5